MTVYVKVLKGRNLKGNDIFSKADPFIVVSHAGFTEKTRVFENNENPEFNEVFTLNYVKGKFLVFQLWDDNSPAAADLIAEHVVDITSFYGITQHTWIDFKRDSGKAAGEIETEISFYLGTAAPPGYLKAINPQFIAPSPSSISLSSSSSSGNVPCSFRPNTKGAFTSKETSEGRQFVFDLSEDDVRTVFVDHRITEGIFLWKVRIQYAKKTFFIKKCECGIGVASSLSVSKHDDCCLTDLGDQLLGSCSLQLYNHGDYVAAYLAGVKGGPEFLEGVEVTDGSVVAAEIDMTKHVLSFFINDDKIPYAISLLRCPLPSLYLGMSVKGKASFTSISLSKLTHVVPSPVMPRIFEVVTKENMKN